MIPVSIYAANISTVHMLKRVIELGIVFRLLVAEVNRMVRLQRRW
jgi:hypothetical protein